MKITLNMKNQASSKVISVLIGTLTLTVSFLQPRCTRKDLIAEKIARLEAMNIALKSSLESCKDEADLAYLKNKMIIDSLNNIIHNKGNE